MLEKTASIVSKTTAIDAADASSRHKIWVVFIVNTYPLGVLLSQDSG
jgi:hypothetical protein